MLRILMHVMLSLLMFTKHLSKCSVNIAMLDSGFIKPLSKLLSKSAKRLSKPLSKLLSKSAKLLSKLLANFAKCT